MARGSPIGPGVVQGVYDGPISVFTMPIYVFTMTDPGVHHADPGVHDGAILVFTMHRSERSRRAETRTELNRLELLPESRPLALVVPGSVLSRHKLLVGFPIKSLQEGVIRNGGTPV